MHSWGSEGNECVEAEWPIISTCLCSVIVPPRGQFYYYYFLCPSLWLKSTPGPSSHNAMRVAQHTDSVNASANDISGASLRGRTQPSVCTQADFLFFLFAFLRHQTLHDAQYQERGNKRLSNPLLLKPSFRFLCLFSFLSLSEHSQINHTDFLTCCSVPIRYTVILLPPFKFSSPLPRGIG